MSGDEKNPKNLVDEGGKGDSGNEKENDKVGPSNKEKKERNDGGGQERGGDIR